MKKVGNIFRDVEESDQNIYLSDEICICSEILDICPNKSYIWLNVNRTRKLGFDGFYILSDN